MYQSPPLAPSRETPNSEYQLPREPAVRVGLYSTAGDLPIGSRSPFGRLSPFDPGIFSDEEGSYFTGDPLAGGSYNPSNLTYAGQDPSVFNIGKKSSAY